MLILTGMVLMVQGVSPVVAPIFTTTTMPTGAVGTDFPVLT